MTALKSIARVTVYADSVLENPLLERFLALGARGYTVIACRGRGKREILDDPFGGIVRVRIEVLVRPEVGQKILDDLSGPHFRGRAVIASLETVQVAAEEEF